MRITRSEPGLTQNRRASSTTIPRPAIFHVAEQRAPWREREATALKPKISGPAASGHITHTRFLVSAERLFCVYGYEGTKIRAIATLSNANLGMLSHYWGSKRALFREVFDRRLRPLHEEQMRRFRALEKAHKAGKPVSLVEVLQAQIEPMFMLPRRTRRMRARSACSWAVH